VLATPATCIVTTVPYLTEAVVLEDLLHIIHLGQQPDGTAIKQLRLQHSKKAKVSNNAHAHDVAMQHQQEWGDFRTCKGSGTMLLWAKWACCIATMHAEQG
jgi:hypothetical protein